MVNKREFISALRKELAPLSESDRSELLADYEAHFTFGTQSGKSEEEIAHELGSPQELAREAFGYNGVPELKAVRAVSVTRTIFSIIGLLFLNLMLVIPVAAALWSVWLGVCAAAVSGIFSPLLVVVDWIIHSSFSGMKLFLSVAVCGLGIFAAIAARYIGKLLAQLTRMYVLWNYRVAKGEQ